MSDFHHRPTLKQQNKPFKSKHASKNSLRERSKGKVARESPKTAKGASQAVAQSRANRRNGAKLIQLKKRADKANAVRIFSGADGVPRIVSVVPLSADVSSRDTVLAVAAALDVDASDCPQHGLYKLKAGRFKTSLQFILLPYRAFWATLDAVKASDYLLLTLSPEVEVDTWGDTLLRCLQAQGFPHVVATSAACKSGDPSILKSLSSFIRYFIPEHYRVYDLSSSSDALGALRSLCEGAPSDVRWREDRPWVLAEDVQRSEIGEAMVTGIVRGAPISVNRLVHVPGHGDFQLSKVESGPLPSARSRANGMQTDASGPMLLADPSLDDADSLISTNVPEALENEQTWPTEEEMNGDTNMDYDLPDAQQGTTPRRVKRIPKGMSAYQAAWIVDESDGEEGEGSGDSASADGEDDAGSEAMELLAPDTEENNSERKVQFEDLPMEEENNQYKQWRGRARKEQEDFEFPDEVDTPQDIEARIRFQRFRGLRSFRTSPWDPYENLPRDYGRLFQFEDFRLTERSVKRRAEEDQNVAQPGTRVTIHLRNTPSSLLQAYHPVAPFVVFGLFQHEHKVSVVNMTVQRNTEYSESVRSKDPLIVCLGPRRFLSNPVYSQHTRGGGKGVNNVHKFERWLRHGVTSVASIYAPVTFGKPPCMLLRGTTEDVECPQLVAMGSFLNTETTRIITKRVILTGHPFKVHKRTATIRYMFFNADDVRYFKPLQLHTKHGRAGHISESLGTHGYYKAHFDGPITQMDTVCMSLYKRVYPRWSSHCGITPVSPLINTNEEKPDAEMTDG